MASNFSRAVTRPSACSMPTVLKRIRDLTLEALLPLKDEHYVFDDYSKCIFLAKQNKKRENKRKRKQERQCSLIVLLLLKDSQGQFGLAEHLIISLNLALTVERFLRMLSYNPV